ncbi:MAG: hypothetical protein JSS49_27215 [Planctomycetes bacterium]|nr:hypothetical protein [Planctomycetota bacterium]
MNSHLMLKITIATTLGLTVWAITTKSAAENQTPTEKIVIDASKPHLEKLKQLTPEVQSQARSVRSAIELMHFQYDAIMAIGPGAKREELVALYEHDMPKVVAQLANLTTSLDSLEPATEDARKFLDTYEDFRSLEAWKLLEQRALVAMTAVINARKITRPPKLPNPLPEEKTPDVTITKQEAPGTTRVNKSNELLVTVHNNRKYTSATATIEAGFGSGPGKFLESPRQQVKLTPNETRILIFKYTATDEGEVRIGARVLP